MSEPCYCDDSGRVVWCPICLYGKNREDHLIVECEKLKDLRDNIKLGSSTLTEFVIKSKKRGIRIPSEILRLLLSGGDKSMKFNFKNVSEVLTKMREEFFSIWTNEIM